MNFNEGRLLGRTGIKVGRLGISSSYGAPARAYEEAFERGCNYFLIGSFFRGRSREMARAIRNIISKGKRDELVIAVNDNTHIVLLQHAPPVSGYLLVGLYRPTDGTRLPVYTARGERVPNDAIMLDAHDG